MSDRFRVPNHLGQRLHEHGVAVPVVLQRAGLPAAFFQQDKIHVTTAELFALWQAVSDTSTDPAIGLRLGTLLRFEHYSPTGVAALCSRSYRDALQRIGRYKRLTCPEEVRVRSLRDGAVVEFVYTQADVAEPHVLVDMGLSWLLSVARLGSGMAVAPLRVELMRPARHRDLLEEHFGCRVVFAARRNALVIDERDMDRPFVTRNDDLLAMLGMQLEHELKTLVSEADVGTQVKQALKRSMTGKRPTLEDVAQELRMSERTLQRRLTATGRTFQQLTESARHELAHQYLRHSPAELHEVAYLLGYEDPNSFIRAFHDWEGTSPGEWRNRHREPLIAS